MTGFGLGVTDQPGAEALTGIEAAPASTTAARKTDTFAALRPIRPPRERRRPSAGRTEDTIPARPAESAAGAATAGRLVQNFMIHSNASVAVRGTPGPCSAAGRWRAGRCLVLGGLARAEPGRVHEPFAGGAEPVADLDHGR